MIALNMLIYKHKKAILFCIFFGHPEILQYYTEIPDSSPELLPQKSGALPMSHHISAQSCFIDLDSGFIGRD